MKTLVTGAAGFVGENLCSALETAGIHYIPVVRKATLRFYKKEIVVKELTLQTSWSNLLKDVEVVVHLANRAHVMREESIDPYKEYKAINVDATVNLAEQAIKADVKRFIYVSSIKVNGEFTTLKPFDEEDKPKPMDDYGKTKFEAEEALKVLCADSKMELVIIRPPLIYGPGVKANFLNLINLCKKRLPLPFGGIQNKRSFIYVENLVLFIKECITHPSAGNHTFLVSDNDDQSTASLISIIRTQLNKPICLITIPNFILSLLFKVSGKDILVDRLLNNLQVDISKARRVLGWSPTFTFEEGIAITLKSFKN